MQQQFGDEVQFIGVASRDGADAIAAFVDDFGVGEFEHVVDLDGEVWERYEVVSQPSFVFVNDDGTIERTGGLGLDGLTERVETLAST